MNRAMLILTAVLGGLFAYIGGRDLHAGWEWALLAIPFLLLWTIPVVLWSLERELPLGLTGTLYRAGFASAGFLSFLLVLNLARDLVLWPALLLGVESLRSWDSLNADRSLLSLSAFFFLLGLMRALLPPVVRDRVVEIEGLPESFTELRIAQLTDLHIGPTLGRRFVERVVSLVNDLDPDLIAITGDLVDGEVKELREMVAPLASLRSRLGVFYVIGNHEHYWDSKGWIEETRRLGMRVLLNTSERIQLPGASLLVGGVIDPAVGARDPVAAMGGAEGLSADLRILLAHQPGAAPEAERAGFQLQLSGHTHAGQFHPWTWVARLFHHHFLGLSREGRMWVHVGPGTGSWGPPVRLGTTQEITHLRIRRAKR